MIRKWLKLNSCYVRLFKNHTASKNLDHQWVFYHPRRHYCFSHGEDDSLSTVPPISNVPAIISPPLIIPDTKDKADDEHTRQSREDDFDAAPTPAETKVFEVIGPNNSAFLIEVQRKDYEEVRKDLVRLKGDFFHFDKSALMSFTLKCILTAEPKAGFAKNPMRLARVHAISSGCEGVFMMNGVEKFFFVNSLQNKRRAKKMLEKLGYRITGLMYRFQPREMMVLEDRHMSMCLQFLGAVQNLKKVISITHNLNDE